MWCLYMHLMPIMFGYDTQRQPMMFDTTNVKPGRTCIQVPYSVTTPVPSLILWKRAARTFCETFLLLYPDIQVWNDSFDSCIKLNVSEAVTCGDISDVLVMFRDVVVFCRRGRCHESVCVSDPFSLSSRPCTVPATLSQNPNCPASHPSVEQSSRQKREMTTP